MRTIVLASLIALAGSRAGPTDAAMASLIRELQSAFPREIAAISYENAPPLDPPTIFVDIAPEITAADELVWLCESVGPRVDAIDPRIEVATTYHYLRTDCPGA